MELIFYLRKTSTVAQEWVNGETFLYFGRAYRLSIVANQDADLMLKEGRFCLSRKLIDSGGIQSAKKAFEDFFIQKGIHRFNERADYYAPKVVVKISGIKVKVV